MALPGGQHGKALKEAYTVTGKSCGTQCCLLSLEHALTSYQYFLQVCYNYFINCCQEKLFTLYPGHQTDLLTCFSQSRFQNNCVLFMSAPPPLHLPLPVFGTCIGESQTQHRSFPSYYILKLSLQQYPPHTSQQRLFSAAKEWLWFTLDSRKTNLELLSFQAWFTSPNFESQRIVHNSTNFLRTHPGQSSG